MNIFIASDFDGNPISVLLAKTREQADIAWAGMKDMPHSVEEIDPENDDIGVHGLVFLLTSEEIESRDLPVSRQSKGLTFRKWKRGL